jgi:hypothetical protein
MAGPRLPRNERLQDSKGQVDQRFLRFWDQVKGRAYDSIRAFASLTTAADVDVDNDYVPIFDASDGTTKKALVSAIAGDVAQAPTVTIITAGTTTYTKPAECLAVQFKAVGAGATGETGNVFGSDNRRGGGSGTYGEVFVSGGDIASTITVQVGAGNSGTATLIGSGGSIMLCPAAQPNGSSTQASPATGADFSIQGQLGDMVQQADADAVRGGGSSSPLGNAGPWDVDQRNASGYGSGGNSGRNGLNAVRTPGTGAPGVIIAIEYN